MARRDYPGLLILMLPPLPFPYLLPASYVVLLWVKQARACDSGCEARISSMHFRSYVAFSPAASPSLSAPSAVATAMAAGAEPKPALPLPLTLPPHSSGRSVHMFQRTTCRLCVAGARGWAAKA